MTRIYRYFCLIVLLCSVQSVYADNKCQVDYAITSDWGNGFTTNVTVINQGDAWSGWNATWTMPSGQQITGLWNGQHSQTDANVSVNHYDWNANINTGANLTFGFNGSYSGENLVPNDFRINGTLCSGQAPLDTTSNTTDDTNTTETTPVIEAKSCRVDYQVSTQWNTGFTSNVTVENTGAALAGWTLTWDMPNQQKITTLWNGSYQQSNQAVQVSHLDWNKNIAKGANISFGFNASHEGTNQIPGNITLDGVLCDGQTDPTPLVEAVICEVDYSIRDQWDTGFVSDVVIKNQGSALNNWQVTWTMPTAQTVTQSWNGEFNQQGDAVTVTPANWNKIIPTGEQLEFGFTGAYSGENPVPIDIRVNGTKCAGQADQILIRPQAPSNLQISLQDNLSAVLTWDDNSNNEASFRIERRKSNQNWQELSQASADSRHYTDSTLVLGQGYEYRLSAQNSTGISSYSNVVFAMRQDHSDIGVQTLIENCYICHNTEGASQGAAIPTIAGLEKDYIVSTMTAYQIGTKTSTIMGRIAKGYSASQINAIATELASKNYTAATQQTDAVLVALGRKIHDENCSVCHTDNGRASTTGSPLAGQWKPYLVATVSDFIAGNNSSLPQAMINQLSSLQAQYGSDAIEAIAEFYAANPDDSTGYNSDNNSGDSNTDNGNSNGGTGDTGTDSGGGANSSALAAPIGMSVAVIDNESVAITWLDQSSNETGFKVERSGTDNVWQVIATLAANSATYSDSNVSADNNYNYRVGAYDAQSINYSETASSTLLTTLAYGKQVYETKGCASCHGDRGLGGFTNVPVTNFTRNDLSRLTQINATTMPRTEPSNCIGNCAAASASYIIEVLAANSSNSDGSNGTDTTQACSGSSPASTRSLRLLTRYEYQNTVNDLLGLSVNVIHELPDENLVAGFDNNSAANQVTSLRLEAFLNKAETLAQQAVSQNLNSLVPCNTTDNNCAQQFISSLGKRAYRRPLSNTEQAAYLAFFAQDSFDAAVEKSLMTFLMSPHFLYRSELGALQTDGSYQLSAYEIASQLSYLFWGSMPDAELMQLADNNALNSDAERITQATRLFNHPRSREALGNFAGQWLLGSSPYSLAEKDQAIYPNYTANVREAFSQELVNFFNHVTFDSSQKYRELFTNDYILANNVLANYYGFSGVSGTSFAVTPVLNGSRTGVLSLGAVLAKYATSNSSHPFKRGAFFMERLLCHDLPEPANMGVIEAPVPDPNATTRELFSFHSESNTACYSCHQYLDGPGFAFENYDGAGQFRATENNQVINPAGILRGLETYTATEELAFSNLAQLGGILAESPNASQCLARQYYRYTMGREENSADSCVLQDYLTTYQVSDYNLQTMLLGIVNSPNFTKRRAQ